MRALIGPRTVARRRLKALERQFALALEGRVSGVHQTRVAGRRLRELLPVLASSPNDPRARKVRRELRALTRALGPVRELDVALESLAEVATRWPQHAGALAAVRERFVRERQDAAGHLTRLRDVDIERLAGRVHVLAAERTTPAAARRCAARIAERIGARGRALQRAVGECGTLFAIEPLHRARIALKKFRYTLELGEQIGRFRLVATLRHLKSLQDRLGHLHDLHVLAARIRDCEGADPAGHDALEAVALGLDEEMRQVHCAFLAEGHRLGPVLAMARRVRVQLGVLAVRMSPAPSSSAGDGVVERRAG
ncbi:MAG: CHAD domain-containing protein [Acidobacteriota bacterium]